MGHAAADKIATRYYAGTWPIYPGSATMLRESLETAELVLTMFNQHLEWITWLRTEGAGAKRTPVKTPPPAGEPIDLAALRASSIPMAVDLAQRLVVMAKAEAACFMGETREALAIVKARIWPAER